MVKVTIILGINGLQNIQVNNDLLDIDAIREKQLEEWFEESDGRDGWEGLLSEVYNKVGDRNAEIVWDIWGPENFKQQFNNCLAIHNVPTTKAKDVPIEDTKEKLWADAEKYDHRGQYVEAFKLYKNLADNYNFADAQCKVGEYYFNNYTATDVNKEKAFLYYEKAAEQGNVVAQDNLGNCYYNGEGVEKNDSEAMRWYQKAAEQGNKYSQYSLGLLYYNEGNGKENELKQAVYWFCKAAEQGHIMAQSYLV